jgi:hypothetical protein
MQRTGFLSSWWPGVLAKRYAHKRGVRPKELRTFIHASSRVRPLSLVLPHFLSSDQPFILHSSTYQPTRNKPSPTTTIKSAVFFAQQRGYAPSKKTQRTNAAAGVKSGTPKPHPPSFACLPPPRVSPLIRPSPFFFLFSHITSHGLTSLTTP